MNPNNNRKTTNLLLDVLLLAVLLLSFEQHATGITVHEWLGIAIAVILIIHVLLHWKWITCVISNFFREKTKGQRLKFILGILIFVSFSTIIFTGMMISRSALPAMGIQTSETPFWKWLHFFAVDLSVWLVAVHIALNWSWIVKTTKNLISSFRLNLNLRHPPAPTLTLTPFPAAPASAKEGTLPPSFVIKKAFNISIKIFLILIVSAAISLAWYGLSSTSFAETRNTRHVHENFNERNGAGPGTHGFHRGRNMRIKDPAGSMDSHHSGLMHQNENFSLIHALPGMAGHLLIISAVTGIVAVLNRKKGSE